MRHSGPATGISKKIKIEFHLKNLVVESQDFSAFSTIN